ncbi:thioesterase domain-containing protein [Bradyrhizobium sp. B117]|uniref:thioesterase domain-containing protein n=1 Tax=Bradyrhizobium sp. B117 TaxID=3140246 RepID=UPI0031842667
MIDTDQDPESPPLQAAAAAQPVLFLLPGSLGYGASLAALAASIREMAHVVPIRYPELGKILQGQDSVCDMAAAALEQISRVQPRGSVRLLGHSLGGAVAFEVATRLVASGRSVTFFGILDTSLMGERSSAWETLSRTVHRVRSNRVTASRMVCRAFAKAAVAIGREADLARMIDRRAKGQFSLTTFRLKQELQEVLRAKAYFRWLAEPKSTLPISAVLFRCKRKKMPQALGWDRAFTHVDVVPTAGTHTDLVMPPYLTMNLHLVQNALSQAYSPAELPDREGDCSRVPTSKSQPNRTSVQ